MLKHRLPANFPSINHLEDYDFEFQKSVEESKIKKIATLEFINRVNNVIFIGNPGTGKTHLAAAIGIKACEMNYSTHFTTLSNMINPLIRAKKTVNIEIKSASIEDSNY